VLPIKEGARRFGGLPSHQQKKIVIDALAKFRRPWANELIDGIRKGNDPEAAE